MRSKAEKLFRAEYPNARVVVDKHGAGSTLKLYTVYAGDYACGASYSRTKAFVEALMDAHYGAITPDPNEVATTEGHPNA